MPTPLLPPFPADQLLTLSPTDISQFIRLEQCERYLRLRLHEREEGGRFLRAYEVQPQSIPPLLTRSGRVFEETVESAVQARYPNLNLAREVASPAGREPDNERVLQEARDLSPGETLVLFQVRLRAQVGGWLLTGDADVIRLEKGPDGALDVLVADMKSTTAAKVEHRLQVAFYHTILAGLLEREGLPVRDFRTAILYRGAPSETSEDPAEAERLAREREAAADLFGVEAYLELVPDPIAYLEAVRELVTDPASLARQVAGAEFAQLPFHLTYKCDGCLYNEFCMKWSAEQDDLSLIPHLSAGDKSALRRLGIVSTTQLATLKEFAPATPQQPSPVDLTPAPGKEDLCRTAAVTWPVGPRLDELIHRARRYRRWKKDDLRALTYIPSRGYGSLPYSNPDQNPNLIRVYIDAQHDYLQDRVYLLGARIVACEAGLPVRAESIVHLTEGVPDTPESERRLLVRWINDTLQTLVELAAPDKDGLPKAPIHLIFFNSFEQKVLLQALSRHFTSLLDAAPALYDFMTQLAAFDSPIATFIDQEIRELKNYPMVSQSLQAVAAHLKFSWSEPEPFTELFRDRLFDSWGRLSSEEGAAEWYTSRSRFNSQIPLEFAYAAWGELPEPPLRGRDDYAAYRASTPALLQRFHARRLEALERIAADFTGNRQTEKRAFDLPRLAQFDDRARSLAQALDEFMTIERHVELDEWKSIRLAPPERRVLMGETLLVQYVEADQSPAVAEQNRENERRRRLTEEYRAAYKAANPTAKQVRLPKEQKAASEWSQEGLELRLRLVTTGLDCSLDEALALCTLKEGSRLVVSPRWTLDERLPREGQTPFTPTPRQMLYGTRTDLVRFELERDAGNRVVAGWAIVRMSSGFSMKDPRAFLFGSIDRPLLEEELYTLDPCPNNIYGFWCAKVTAGLRELAAAGGAGQNTLYARIADPPGPQPEWPETAAAAQARFLAGLDAFREAGLFHDFEPGKREFIAEHGGDGILLVQGPPGTGKSYTTAFALFARLQGAMAAGRDFRAFVSCKTHAATDVLLHNVLAVQEKLRALREADPDLFLHYLDPRLLQIPLYRLAGRELPPVGIEPLTKDDDKESGAPRNLDILRGERWCVVGATPGGIYGLVKGPNLFNTPLLDCLVLDEASQMNLPEAAMAALPLRPGGQLIVVGDHRQMPPIVQHDWAGEPRRTFQEYRAYESLFLTLLPLSPPIIRFEQSFRLHRDMARFLREEIYEQDGIPYFSTRTRVLPLREIADPFIQAVLDPAHPIVVVVHEEGSSQSLNLYEEALIRPILEELAHESGYGLDAAEGLGVVVPHRSQRASLQMNVPCLTVLDPASGTVTRSAVDTVERFQGGEREVILISATESDREYLLVSSQFLLDPRRLTVAMSRAKQKLVLVAARSVFSLFSPDEETFAHSQLWKNLLRRTCTRLLWEGEREGHPVQVWGNAPSEER